MSNRPSILAVLVRFIIRNRSCGDFKFARELEQYMFCQELRSVFAAGCRPQLMAQQQSEIVRLVNTGQKSGAEARALNE